MSCESLANINNKSIIQLAIAIKYKLRPLVLSVICRRCGQFAHSRLV